MKELNIWVVLILLLLTSCKTKEKVTEQHIEHVETTQQLDSNTDEKHESLKLVENEHDSIVDKIRVLIIKDSTGRVLRQEFEHSREKHKTRNNDKETVNEAENVTSNANNKLRLNARWDNTHNASKTDVEKSNRSSPWKWYHSFLLIVALLGSIMIIYKIKR